MINWRFFALGFLVLCRLATPAQLRAAATLTQQIDPPEVSVGDLVSVTFTIQNGSEASIEFPRVDGLQSQGSSSTTQITFSNGVLMSAASQTFTMVPLRAGDFTIPAFDIHTQNGEVLHAREMKLHVLNANGQPQGNSPVPQNNGPVVMPPGSGISPAPSPIDNNTGTPPAPEVQVPVDSSGQPAKVFMSLTAKTTDAYVGQTIPVRIEFYIRADSMTQQDSLPTINGSDFLLNDLSVRPLEDETVLMDEPYHRETWVTAISAPRSGDFPLQMTRDTYWIRNPQNVFANPLDSFFSRRSNLVHANIQSNKLVIHAKSLPSEGRPHDFTGAIGEFRATGGASPATVNAGDPAYLDFTVAGEGNFDSVRCPVLAPDPAWKTYVANSQVHYIDESRTNGEKDFHQAIIPRKNGVLQLPSASFSYFDPTAGKYMTIQIPLPALTVTGSLPSPVVAAPANPTATPSTAAPAAPAATGFNGNRLEFGLLHTTLMPAYRKWWFWLPQAGLVLLTLIALLGFSIRSRLGHDPSRLESALRQRSLHELEMEMSAAAARDDAPAFFLAARRAVQLRWGPELGLPPEAVTPSTLAQHDPQLAEAASPLFQQADEINYSGQASGTDLDLVAWEKRVREMLLHAQPA